MALAAEMLHGRNPVADQDPLAFTPLTAELADLSPANADNAYPFAYERLASLFAAAHARHRANVDRINAVLGPDDAVPLDDFSRRIRVATRAGALKVGRIGVFGISNSGDGLIGNSISVIAKAVGHCARSRRRSQHR